MARPRLQDSTARTWVQDSAGARTSGHVLKLDSSIAVTAGVLGANGGTHLTRLGASTYSTLQDFVNLCGSAGYVSGGTVTDAGSNTVNVAAGTGFIRPSDSDTSVVEFFNWPAANGLSVPSGSTRWVNVSYNAGVPVASVSSTDSADGNTSFELAVCFNEAGTIHVYFVPQRAGNTVKRIGERWHGTRHVARDEYLGGLILTESGDGNRRVLVSSGTLWHKLDDYSIAALNTGTGSTFTAYYRDGSGGFTAQAAQTAWDNTYYDDGTGTLATLATNKYGNRWFYLQLDGTLVCLYGRTQYDNLATALLATPPTTLPSRTSVVGVLIGLLTFQKSATTASNVSSAFITTFASASVADHAALADLAILSSGHTVSATDRLVGRDTTGSGLVEELTVGGGLEFTGSGGLQRSALTGAVTASAGSNATTLAGTSTGTASTTDATVTTCGTYAVPDLSTVFLTSTVVAHRDDHTQGAGYQVEGVFRRSGGTVTQVGATLSVLAAEDNVLWDATYDVSGTDVRVRVTGAAATNLSWKSRISAVVVP